MTKYEKDDRGPLDLTRQIGELQCEIAGLKTKIHDAELETSLVKAVGMNSPEMKAAKKEIETLVSLRVNKIINKMNLVKRDEFEVLKKMVQKALIENEELKKAQKKPSVRKKKTIKKKKKPKK